jgi:hypothetical protein
MKNLTATEQRLIGKLYEGFQLSLTGRIGEYRPTLLSPPDSNLNSNDVRREYVKPDTVNHLFKLGLLREVETKSTRRLHKKVAVLVEPPSRVNLSCIIGQADRGSQRVSSSLHLVNATNLFKTICYSDFLKVCTGLTVSFGEGEDCSFYSFTPMILDWVNPTCNAMSSMIREILENIRSAPQLSHQIKADRSNILRLRPDLETL